MNGVGKNICRFRGEAGLTQEALSEKLHVTRQAVSGWETGRTCPDVDTLLRLSEALAVPVEALIYGEKVMAPQPRDTAKYKKWALILACVTAMLAAARLIMWPRVLEYKAVYYVLPWWGWGCTLLPAAAFMTGAGAALSLLGAAADVAIRSKRLRAALLAAGGVLLTVPLCMLAFPALPTYALLIAVKYPAAFVIPAALIFLGINRP